MTSSPTLTPSKPRPNGARKPGKARLLKSNHAEAPAPINHGYFKSFDGTKIFYSTEGRGRPLIFCYGLVCSSLHWTYQIQYFQKDYKAVWFDYRGHQNSEIPKNLNTLTLENVAKDLGILLDELNIKDAVLLGHSMGVNVVLEFYRQQPDRVAGMILANGTGQRPLETFFGTNALQPGFKLLRRLHDVAPRLVSFVWRNQYRNPFSRTLASLGGFNAHLTPKEDIDFYIKSVGEIDPEIFLNLVESYETYDATPWLHTVKAPTLILGGQCDTLTPMEQQQLLHQLIPNSRLEVIRHGSHCAQMDLPDLVNLKIEKFLNEIEYT